MLLLGTLHRRFNATIGNKPHKRDQHVNRIGNLVQLPPSVEFNARVATEFFTLLRERHAGAVVCEPRHRTWFAPRAVALLVAHRVGLVATDPSSIAEAKRPGAWMGRKGDGAGSVIYYRLHGSPRKYWSRCSIERIEQWASELRALPDAADAWRIFDNTASGSAIQNALELKIEVSKGVGRVEGARRS